MVCFCKDKPRYILYRPLQMGIANRDIKLENTLLMDVSNQPVLKLCDFGYSKDEFLGSACKTMCGRLAAACHVTRSLLVFSMLAHPLGSYSAAATMLAPVHPDPHGRQWQVGSLLRRHIC
jgi:serine/threonine protein kinase